MALLFLILLAVIGSVAGLTRIAKANTCIVEYTEDYGKTWRTAVAAKDSPDAPVSAISGRCDNLVVYSNKPTMWRTRPANTPKGKR
jgi:hypothetical protein